MRKSVAVVLFLLALSLMFTQQVFAKQAQEAPDFTLQDIYQDKITLSDYKDSQPVLLFFWTTWCPFCAKELPVLKDMYSGLVKDGVEVLSINVGEMPDKVSLFVKDLRLPYRVLLDKDTEVASSYKLIGVPTYMLIDKQGNIVFQDNFFPSNYKELVK